MFRRVAYGCLLLLLLLAGCEKLPPVGLPCTPGSQECGDGLICNANNLCQLCDGGNCAASEPGTEPTEPATELAEPTGEVPPETTPEEVTQEPPLEPALDGGEPLSEPVMEPPSEPAPERHEPLSEPLPDGGEPPPELAPDAKECTPGGMDTCYSGDPTTKGIGVCQSGTHTCLPNGTWSTCSGEVTPTKETCNKKDDDCDGEVDEDLSCP